MGKQLFGQNISITDDVYHPHAQGVLGAAALAHALLLERMIKRRR